MAGDLVFITGGTGHIGFAVLRETLKEGYRVRASVRRAEQIDEIKNHPDIKPFVTKLEFVVVPDITVEGAFDTALQDVTHIQHIASPLPHKASENPEQDIVIPAIRGTTSILYSALQKPTIRRVVITSSIGAVIPIEAARNGDIKDIYTARSRVNPLPLTSGPWTDVMSAYVSSKALALDATERFIAEQKPHFSIVSVMPGFVIGPNRLVKEAAQAAQGSNNKGLTVILGQKHPAGQPFTIADLRDVVRVHVGSLDENKVPGNQNFIVDGPKAQWEDAAEIARKHFPEAVKDGRLPLGGELKSFYLGSDAADTVKVFGPLRTFEDAVVSLVEQYLELLGKA